MKIDPQFTKKIQSWLNKEPKTSDDALSGARLLLQINPRNAMYRRFINLAVIRPKRILPKIIHEMNAHLKYRLDGLTLEEVNRLDRNVIPEASGIINSGKPATDDDILVIDEQGNIESPCQVVLTEKEGEQIIVKQRGRREDHELLPENIQALWNDNAKLYKNIKALFEELKSMDNLPSCQRYDKLQLLASMDKKYFRRMQEYDAFKLSMVKCKDIADATDSVDTAKSITSARAYISKNKAKLAMLHDAAVADGASADALDVYMQFAEKMQKYVNTLLSANVVTDEMKASLSPIGIAFDIPAPDENKADTENSEASE